MFSDLSVVVHPLDVGGDRACVEWLASAVQSVPFPLGDGGGVVEPTSRRLQLRGVSVAEFDGPRISVFRHYWDEASLLGELGLLPED